MQYDLILQRQTIGQHRSAKPFADQGICKKLRTGAGLAVVQQDTVSIDAIAAAVANQRFDFG